MGVSVPNLFNIVYCYPAWEFESIEVGGYTKVGKLAFCTLTFLKAASFRKEE